MRTSVAAAIVAPNVIATAFVPDSAALSAAAPTTSVVYCGTPLSETGWSNVIVTTAPSAVAVVTAIGVVRSGTVCAGFFRRDELFFRGLRPMIPAGMAVSFQKKGQGARGQG